MEGGNKLGKSVVVRDEQMSGEVQERAQKLKELRDKLRARDGEKAVAAAMPSSSGVSTPRTPRTQEIISEYEKFRPKTPTNFKADFN
jgi:hypothetical protein